MRRSTPAANRPIQQDNGKLFGIGLGGEGGWIVVIGVRARSILPPLGGGGGVNCAHWRNGLLLLLLLRESAGRKHVSFLGTHFHER